MGRQGRAPHTQFLSFSCSFRQKVCKIIGWRPTSGIGVSHLVNPGSTTSSIELLVFHKIISSENSVLKSNTVFAKLVDETKPNVVSKPKGKIMSQ